VENGTNVPEGIKKIVQGITEMRKLTLHGRSEVIVKLPVENGSDRQE
jgi:hypothetical protein